MAGELRARDVRTQIQGVVDPRVVRVIETLAEQQHQLAKNQTEIAMLVDKMADITRNFVGVAENMKKVIERGRQEDDLDDTVKPQ